MKKIDNEKLTQISEPILENLDKVKNFLDNSKDIVTINNTLVFLSTLSEQIIESIKKLRVLIEVLVKIIKERTGPVRKSAAILLAKICQDKENLVEARKFHATEILINL